MTVAPEGAGARGRGRHRRFPDRSVRTKQSPSHAAWPAAPTCGGEHREEVLQLLVRMNAVACDRDRVSPPTATSAGQEAAWARLVAAGYRRPTYGAPRAYRGRMAVRGPGSGPKRAAGSRPRQPPQRVRAEADATARKPVQGHEEEAREPYDTSPAPDPFAPTAGPPIGQVAERGRSCGSRPRCDARSSDWWEAGRHATAFQPAHAARWDRRSRAARSAVCVRRRRGRAVPRNGWVSLRNVRAGSQGCC